MSNLPVHLSKAIDAMADAAVAIDASSGNFSYVKLTKSGEWVHGSEDDEINAASVFAVDTESFFAGFQSWDNGALAGEELRLLTDIPLLKSDLADVGAEWKAMLGFQMVCVDGPDKGLQVVYKTTSKGGIKEVNNLMKTIVAHVKSGKHDGKLIPLVELDKDNYRHKQYGKIYTPVIEVVGWIDQMPASAVEEAPEPDAVEEEPEVVEEQPVRRRRRA